MFKKLLSFLFSHLVQHDTTLSMLLASLNIKQKVLPLGPAFYGAAIIVELWKTDDDKFMIKV